MNAIAFNDGWAYRLPLGPFAAANGEDAQPMPVRLPHDALRDTDRHPEVPGKGASTMTSTSAWPVARS